MDEETGQRTLAELVFEIPDPEVRVPVEGHEIAVVETQVADSRGVQRGTGAVEAPIRPCQGGERNSVGTGRLDGGFAPKEQKQAKNELNVFHHGIPNIPDPPIPWPVFIVPVFMSPSTPYTTPSATCDGSGSVAAGPPASSVPVSLFDGIP